MSASECAVAGQLDDFGASREQRAQGFRDVRASGRRTNACDSTTPAPAAQPDELLGEVGAHLEVHELGTRDDGVVQDLPPLLFAARERPPLPTSDGRSRSTGRSRPSRAPAGVRPVHAVEAHLDEIGAGRRVPRAAQLVHRPSRDRHAQFWGQILFLARVSSIVDVVRSWTLVQETRSDPAETTKSLRSRWLGGLKSGARAGSRASRQPPQRRRTTTNTTGERGAAGRGRSASKRL